MMLTHVMSLPRRHRPRGGAGTAVARWLRAAREIFVEVQAMRRAADARYHFAED
jgi:hypothetical protein